MKQCIICNEKAGFLSKKTSVGHICRKCSAYLKSNFRLDSYSLEEIKEFYQTNYDKSKVFTTTESYGNLYIDSIHSMLCFSQNKGDEPTMFGDIYYVTEIEEMAIYCSDVRNIGTNTNKIICNVKMTVKTADFTTEYTVAEKENCAFEIKDKNIDWKEPYKLSMFRNMINQMIDNVVFALLEKLNNIQEMNKELSKYGKEKEWARGALLLSNEDFELKDIKKRYRNLSKIFHPDANPDIDPEYIKQINSAYEILSRKNNCT